MSMTEQEQRSEYIAGLRALADLLDSSDTIPLPYAGTDQPMAFYCDGKAQFVETVRAFPGKVDKRVDDTSPVYGFEAYGAIAGIKVVAYVHRDEVCTRVVTGTREVTELVPAPDASMVEVTKTVEDVEWVCEPLLAEATA